MRSAVASKRQRHKLILILKFTVMENLKQVLKSGKVVVFDNERTFTDDFRSAECSFRDKPSMQRANGFKIEFNGAIVVYSRRFDVFERKLEQLKKDWNLELKSW